MKMKVILSVLLTTLFFVAIGITGFLCRDLMLRKEQTAFLAGVLCFTVLIAVFVTFLIELKKGWGEKIEKISLDNSNAVAGIFATLELLAAFILLIIGDVIATMLWLKIIFWIPALGCFIVSYWSISLGCTAEPKESAAK